MNHWLKTVQIRIKNKVCGVVPCKYHASIQNKVNDMLLQAEDAVARYIHQISQLEVILILTK